MFPTKKITRTSYQRPAQTYQDNLSKQQIKEQLKDYKECTDITGLSVGCHVRYFSTDLKTKKKLFRLGGSVNKIDPEYRFIILSNGTVSWSVQIANTTFWKKLTELEYKEELKAELKEEIKKEIMTEDVETVSNQKLEKENHDLKKELKEMSKMNEKLMSKLKSIEIEIKKKKEKNN